MYKVFLVDDEKWVVESLKKGVRWQACGFEVCGWAFDGREALEKIEEIRPDLVITDIRMPEVDGMELIKGIRRTGTGTQIIVISGHSEFSYAKEAIRYGVLGYCLKPVDELEIEDCLRKAAKVIEKSRADLEFKILESILNFDAGKLESLSGIFNQYGLRIDQDETIAVIAAIGEGILEFEKDKGGVSVPVGKSKRIYFVRRDRRIGLPAFMGGCKRPDGVSVGLGNPVDSLADLAAEANKAVLAAYGSFITGCSRIYPVVEYDEKAAAREISRLVRDAASGDIKVVEEAFVNAAQILKTKYPSMKYASSFFNLISSLVPDLPEPGSDSLVSDYGALADEFGNLDNMLLYLKKSVMDQIGAEYELCSDIKNDIVKEMVEYVNSNFFKDISMQSLSEKFYVNPSYASRLFSKEVGEVFTRYLNRVRVKYACDLISRTDLQIGEIASRAGYSDYFYFCKVFRKLTGKTPTQLREEL